MSSLFISANKDTLFPLLSQTNGFKKADTRDLRLDTS